MEHGEYATLSLTFGQSAGLKLGLLTLKTRQNQEVIKISCKLKHKIQSDVKHQVDFITFSVHGSNTHTFSSEVPHLLALTTEALMTRLDDVRRFPI